MIQIRRMIVILATVTVALTGLWQVGRLWDRRRRCGFTSADADSGSLAQPTPTGTIRLLATLSIVPDRTSLRVGNLTLVADIDVSEGCQYPILESCRCIRATDEPPIFAHINDPPADLLTAPITLPSAWTFRATHPARPHLTPGHTVSDIAMTSGTGTICPASRSRSALTRRPMWLPLVSR